MKIKRVYDSEHSQEYTPFDDLLGHRKFPVLAKEEIYGLWIRAPRDERWMGNKGIQKMASRTFLFCRLLHLCRKFLESLHALREYLSMIKVSRRLTDKSLWKEVELT